MDAQLNIQYGAFVSAIYQNKNAYERITYCIVRSSNWSRKTHLALSLLENEYRNHFDFIVIICPTLRYNSTYKSRGWVWNDPDVIPIEPGNQENI